MGKLEVEVEVKSSVDKFWAATKDTANLFPKLFPDRYKSVEIIQGDGKSVGSVLLMKYVEGTPGVTFSKERVDEVDEANKVVLYSVVEGEITEIYKNFKARMQVLPKGDGSLAKWTAEYEAAEGAPEPTFLKELAEKTVQGLDAHALKA